MVLGHLDHLSRHDGLVGLLAVEQVRDAGPAPHRLDQTVIVLDSQFAEQRFGISWAALARASPPTGAMAGAVWNAAAPGPPPPVDRELDDLHSAAARPGLDAGGLRPDIPRSRPAPRRRSRRRRHPPRRPGRGCPSGCPGSIREPSEVGHGSVPRRIGLVPVGPVVHRREMVFLGPEEPVVDDGAGEQDADAAGDRGRAPRTTRPSGGRPPSSR